MRSLQALPRAPLVPAATPLHVAEHLSEAVGVEVWFKRDDLTGLGLGGNKARALEYLIGDALARHADCLVTGAGPQSNWAMLAALAARRYGLEPYLVHYGHPVTATGNLLLSQLTGVNVRFTGDPDRGSVDRSVEQLTAELAAAGRRPYPVPRGGATALGAAGYVRASLEVAGQLLAARLEPTRLWTATGSCGTQAGLLAGARWLRAPYRVTGVTVSRPVDEAVSRVEELAAGAAGLLHLPPGGDSPPAGSTRTSGAERRTGAEPDAVVLGGHLGPGYGEPSTEGRRAAGLVARTEGVFLDPVFGAKAMAALLAATRAGGVTGPVVFLVTGGAPTLFTHGDGEVAA